MLEELIFSKPFHYALQFLLLCFGLLVFIVPRQPGPENPYARQRQGRGLRGMITASLTILAIAFPPSPEIVVLTFFLAALLYFPTVLLLWSSSLAFGISAAMLWRQESRWRPDVPPIESP